MQGLFVDGLRPKSKKAVKEAIAASVPVRLQATSLFGDEYQGSVYDAPSGEYYFVGPDPYTDRRFYGTITVVAGQPLDTASKVTVK